MATKTQRHKGTFPSAERKKLSFLGVLVTLWFASLFSCSSLEKRAQDCLQLGDYERAIKLYNQIIDRDPRHFQGRYGLGLSMYQKAYALQERGEPSLDIWKRAVEELQYASRIDSAESLPQNLANAHYRLAVAFDLTGEKELSLRNLSEALRNNPLHIQALHRMGTLHYEMGQYQKGRLAFQRVLDHDPSYITAYQNLGSCLFALGKRDEAGRIWKAGLVLDPENSFMKKWLARVVE